jgi:hypothetical protein
MEAEIHLKSVLKTKTDQSKEYVPTNYYGRFLKDKIEAAQTSSLKLKINA